MPVRIRHHRIVLSFALLSTLIGCSGKPKPPTSEADFITAYRTAYDAGDRAAVLALVKWDGVPDELRKLTEMALTFGIGNHQIVSIELVAYAPDPKLPMEIEGRKIETNLPPQYWLIVKHKGTLSYDGSESNGSVRYGVGIDNGVFKFCGMYWAKSPGLNPIRLR